ncbi:hypothetical protein [Butyrivibrio sp. FCS006]|uniref:hypothetical protein n=1 Tax=Butyrivibrio sp. FCS006 TaxID=1280684 RepID=UPI00047DE93D|nr:hypothetical protein [Butyrivibrio sp. FCS006]
MAKEDAIPTNNGRIKIVIGICIAIILVLIVVVALLLVRGKVSKQEVKRNVVVTQSNAEQVAEELISTPYVEPGYYTTEMSTTWHFASGDSVSNDAYVRNNEGNTNDVYFDVFLADDETETILESPIIPRGAELKDISLDKSLDAGTYDCVMVYHLVDENQNSISTLRVGFTIVVEN